MGIMDSFKNVLGSGPSDKTAVPFSISAKFVPFRLTAKKNDTIDMYLEITNVASQDVLVSLAVRAPKGIGFDRIMIEREKNFKLETIKPGETKHLRIPLNSTTSTPAKTYELEVEVFSHYRDYKYIITTMKKTFDVRAV